MIVMMIMSCLLFDMSIKTVKSRMNKWQNEGHKNSSNYTSHKTNKKGLEKYI